MPGTVVGVVVVVEVVEVVGGGAQASLQHGREGFGTSASSGSMTAPPPIEGGVSRYSRRLWSPALSVPLIIISPDAVRWLLASTLTPAGVAEMIAPCTTFRVQARSMLVPPSPCGPVPSARSVP